MQMRRQSVARLKVMAISIALLALCAASSAQAQKRPRGNGKKPAPTAESAPSSDGAVSPEAAAVPGDTQAQPSTSGSPTPAPGSATPVEDVEPAAPTPSPEPSAEPAAATPSEPAPPASAAPAAMSKDVAEVMDELVQLRARTRLLGKALFKTKVRIRVENEAAPDQTAVRLQLWLDGAPVWSGDGSGLRDAERVLFEGLAAPGPHVLTYEVEQRARDDEKYRYTQRASLRFMALRERRMELVLVLEDDSDMAEDFDEDEEGEYDVRVRMQVSAHRLDE